jgi:hypothetical protein
MLHPIPRYKTPVKRTHRPLATIAQREGMIDPVFHTSTGKIALYFCVLTINYDER